MRKGAALRLVIEDDRGEQSLAVFAGDDPIPFWRGSIVPSELRDAVDEMRCVLEEVHDIAGNSLDLGPRQSARAVGELLRYAQGVGFGLFHQWPGRFYEEARIRASGAFNPAVGERIVEVTAPPELRYPFELLPWQSLPDGLPDDPALRLRSLLGMSAILRRQLYRVAEPGGETRLVNEPKLPVSVLRNKSLAATAQEVAYFTEVAALVDLYGPWPGTDELAESVAARHLLDSRIGIDGELRRDPVAVLHLACHCVTTDAAENLHFLDLGGPHGTVRLGDLKKQLMCPEGAIAPLPRPLVFLNACTSTAMRPADRGSFTSFLLRQRFLGVIGTLCDISDTVAAHFATIFYQAVLSGSTAGEAMREARWHLMDRHHNPLGLLYTFHGDPDIKLAHAHRGRVVPACRPSALAGGPP
jgi:hypothetical protein